MNSTQSAGFVRDDADRVSRRELAAKRKQLAKAASDTRKDSPDLPWVWLPEKGERHPNNLRTARAVRPPLHRGSSTTLGVGYPFLAETSDAMPGAFIGPDLLSKGMFSWDPWVAYGMGIIRSHSMVILGVKGSGKSMLAKSLAARLCRLRRRVAVPHDPNGEWARVAEYVGGVTVQIGPGAADRINPLDAGTRPAHFTDENWAYEQQQYQSHKLQAIVKILRQTTTLPEVEHTIIDLVLQNVRARNNHVLLPAVWDELRDPTGPNAAEIRDGGLQLQHSIRRVIVGDVAGMFDKPTTVTFDSDTPMVTVDTSLVSKASDEAKALMRLTTNDWIDRSSTGTADQARLVIHEEAAVALLTEVASGSGLTQRAADEKVARHHGKANLYVLHRIADLDALGDTGSAMHSQALGLLADCDTRITYAQHPGELGRSAAVLGWNDTQRELVRKLQKGEGFWQIGEDTLRHVRNVCTTTEMHYFATDTHGGSRA
ncbi:hypothetical protein ACIRCZ_19480 [Leifsonia sp. NPDC102414]|uniref:hypothetical protein n=1 Tax=Leifsonia sp. NPDC102414 TaxID=3364124 RepID=UPI003823968D